MSRLKIACAIVAPVLVCAVMYATAEAEPPAGMSAKSSVLVGTFDSRAVAIAHYRSDAFDQEMKALKTEFEKAKAAGDEKRAKELEAEGPARQELVHKQGFGTYPVDNILEKITDKLPGIADQAGVDVIVSKWDIAYQRPGVELVDITELMVTLFNPDAKTLEAIGEVRKKTPVSSELLEKHVH